MNFYSYNFDVRELETIQARVTRMVDLNIVESCADILKVLADDTRLAVVQQLMTGPKHVNELNEPIGIEQSLLSHHLKVLKEAGLVESERDGKAMLYRLAPKVEARRSGKGLNLGCCRLTFD